MKRYLLCFLVFLFAFSAYGKHGEPVKRPKLVVGLVVDQMRWDYIYRYSTRYGNGGFKRLLREGFNCQNTMVNYMPTYTAPGHSCIYTGSVPSIHGIAGNYWIDNQTGENQYCVDDKKVWLAGDSSRKKSFSPRNLLVTTITDELRLATNFRSRVYGVAIKDRGSILPAGHTANAAYWYNDKTGDFVTSTYYAEAYQNPPWLKAFNERKLANKLVAQGWVPGDSMNTYTQSTVDNTEYEDTFKGETRPVFPHKFSSADGLSALRTIPAGNTLTLEMAKACLAGAEGGKLGGGSETDFLCVSLSSTDYAGHQYGPNAIEMEDMYIKLDSELASFLSYLDKTVGQGNYLFFLTADHGGAHNPKFLTDNKIPAGVAFNTVAAHLNQYLKEIYKKDVRFVDTFLNYQVYLNETLLKNNKEFNRDEIKLSIRKWLLDEMPLKDNVSVSYVVDMEDLRKTPVPEPIYTMAVNGYNYLRSGCLQVVYSPGWFENYHLQGTTHGSWNPYDAHIPLLWFGWHIPKGETHDVVNMTDISPTLAAILNIQMPNGSIGKPIKGLVK